MRYLCVFIIIGIVGGVWSTEGQASCTSECRAGRGCEYDYSSLHCKLAGDDCRRKCFDQSERQSFGAIAYDEAKDVEGHSWGAGSRAIAEQNAIAACRRRDGVNCEAIVWFSGSCGALAVSDQTVEWGTGGSVGAASASAQLKCQRTGGVDCKIRVSQCSPS